MYVEPDFDWYAKIASATKRWGLYIDDGIIDLLVKGLRSSPIAKGRIWSLDLTSDSLSFSQVITQIREFFELDSLLVMFHANVSFDDEVILQQLIAPGSGLRRLVYVNNFDTLNFISHRMFQPSSLQVLDLYVGHEDIVLPHELLPHKNTNLEVLKISSNLLRPLAALIVNITSMIYLEINSYSNESTETKGPLDSDLPVLTNIVQSHRTLEELHVGKIIYQNDSTDSSTNLLQLIEAAGKVN